MSDRDSDHSEECVTNKQTNMWVAKELLPKYNKKTEKLSINSKIKAVTEWALLLE